MRVRKISEVIGLKVYTDSGDYFGEIEEANLAENKIDGWRIRVGGTIMSLIGGARGVIIPHQFVKAVGDVIVVSRASLPLEEGEETVEETVKMLDPEHKVEFVEIEEAGILGAAKLVA